MCRITYTDPGRDHEISSRSLGLHRILFDFSTALSMIQSLFCNFCAAVLHLCWVSALNASSFATQSGKIGALSLQRQGVWECSTTWLSGQGRFMSSQVKEELRPLCTSPCALGIHAALHPLAEFAIAFSSKAKLTSVPPAFPAELGRKAGLLQNQNVF